MSVLGNARAVGRYQTANADFVRAIDAVMRRYNRKGVRRTWVSGQSIRAKAEGGAEFISDLSSEFRGKISGKGSKGIFTHPAKMLILDISDGLTGHVSPIDLNALRSNHE